MITPQQLEQLMRLLPPPSKDGNGDEYDDDMDLSYSGMACCFQAEMVKDAWIIDSGASNHMTGNKRFLSKAIPAKNQPRIKLLTGETSIITHFGTVELENDLILNNVLHVPAFKHNLLSVQKLPQDGDCIVNFHPGYCVIQEKKTGIVRGLGKSMDGLYYLVNESVQHLIKKVKNAGVSEVKASKKCYVKAMNAQTQLKIPVVVKNCQSVRKTTLWHQRLGHAPLERLSKIAGLDGWI